MFRPPSLLAPQVVPTAVRILPQGSPGFYVRAERASSPPHAPDILTVRIQAIDGTGTFSLLVSVLSAAPLHEIRLDPPPMRLARDLGVVRFQREHIPERLASLLHHY